MPALKNKKWEKACQEYVLNGGDQSKAFRKAFPHTRKWKDNTVWTKASLFFKKGEVRERVAELQDRAAKVAEEQFKVDAQYVLRRHVEIDRMDVLDIMNGDGSMKPVGEWPAVWRSFISGLDIAELFEGRGEDRGMVGVLKKIKWPDKVKNLELLGKHVSVNAYRDQLGLSDPKGGPIKTFSEMYGEPESESG